MKSAPSESARTYYNTLMLKLFRSLWQTRRPYIIGLAVTLLAIAAKIVSHPANYNYADFGIFAGGGLFMLVAFGPIVFVRARNLKIGKPKAVFVEPSRWKILAIIVAFDVLFLGVIVALLTLVPGLGDWLSATLEADGFLSGLVMMPIILVVIFGGMVPYLLYIYTRYNRIVEYGSVEWYRRRRK